MKSADRRLILLACRLGLVFELGQARLELIHSVE
jgi:hypothetical protein